MFEITTFTINFVSAAVLLGIIPSVSDAYFVHEHHFSTPRLPYLCSQFYLPASDSKILWHAL